MEHLSSKMEQQDQELQLQWRRDKVQELCSKGYSQREISQVLQVGLATVNRDISYLRDQAKNNIKKYIDERLPEEYEKCLVGLTAITKEAWNAAQQSEDKREKIQALSLAKECYSMKLDLLTNATVVDDAIRFVSQKTIEKLKSSIDSNEAQEEESKEPDYKDDKDQLEEEQEDDGEIDSTTTNAVF
jgi:Trp operon repressor